jgi:crotonobetainyl-CoA:carnitine CoA-transferase CaiB-like acyl-CoA transferase
MGGLMSITGLPGQGPVRVGVPIADLTSGGFLAQGILIALLDREVTGEGRWVQTSLLEAQIALLDFQASRWLINGEVAKQAGNNHPTGTPTGVFATSDGHINIAASGQNIWERLCVALDAKHFLEDPDFSTASGRTRNRNRLHFEIEQISKTKSGETWVKLLNEAGVPCGPINSIDQTFDDPQVKHLGIAKKVAHPRLGELTLVGQPHSIGGVTREIRRATPELGEHTTEILSELGYTDPEIDQLRADRVV